jgi:2-methylisocitrate lyase-like PEP mutase family enzyme
VRSEAGSRLRADVAQRLVPCVGIYDVFSASVAARRFDALFVSGFGFAASHYGLPDVGFIAWPDVVAFVRRLRSILPRHHLLVDIDDGYCDVEVACHVVRELHAAGASGVVLEDQRRPRRCGHLDGKQVLELDEFLPKLERVLAARGDLFVVARTDASGADEVLRRVTAFERAGADAVLADGLRGPDDIARIRAAVRCPVAFNQIAGGKSVALSMDEMVRAGVQVAIYSTPALFAAQQAMEDALDALATSGRLDPHGRIDLAACNRVLDANLAGTVLPPAEAPAQSARGAAAAGTVK